MPSDNQETSLLRRVCKLLHTPPSMPIIIDPPFRHQPSQYFIQSGLATVGMFAVLLMVDSFSDAALALVIGSVFSLVLFGPPIGSVLTNITPLRDLAIAASVGVLIIIMAITDPEHPPAAGTALGMSTRIFDPSMFAIIVGAVLLLSVIKHVLRKYLRGSI